MPAEQPLSSPQEQKSGEQDRAQEVTDAQHEDKSLYMSGWKLHAITFWLLVALFVAQMDTSVASTAILQITDQLGGYEESSWVFTAYMLTYCGKSSA
jgi:hypothetical protein